MKFITSKESTKFDFNNLKIPLEIQNILNDKEIVVPENLMNDPLLKFPEATK